MAAQYLRCDHLIKINPPFASMRPVIRHGGKCMAQQQLNLPELMALQLFRRQPLALLQLKKKRQSMRGMACRHRRPGQAGNAGANPWWQTIRHRLLLRDTHP